MFETHEEGPNGRGEGVALSGAQNELDFCSGLGDLAPATHVGSWQRGCRLIARAGSDGGCICNPFDSAPPRSYDVAGRGGDSVELNWGTRSVGCEKKKITRGRRTRVAGIIYLNEKKANVCRFPAQTLRCDPHEARIYGVSNKKPLFNCV
jgi:hypothetical protein